MTVDDVETYDVEKFRKGVVEMIKDLDEKAAREFNEEASKENPDPTEPNPYEKGTEEHNKHLHACIKSMMSLCEKEDKHWLEKYKNFKNIRNASKLLSDREIQDAITLFDTEEYYTDLRKRIDAKHVAQNSTLADENTQNQI